jgi:uncharacterized membrane protein
MLVLSFSGRDRTGRLLSLGQTHFARANALASYKAGTMKDIAAVGTFLPAGGTPEGQLAVLNPGV